MTKFNLFRKTIVILTNAFIYGLLVLLVGLVWLGVIDVYSMII